MITHTRSKRGPWAVPALGLMAALCVAAVAAKAQSPQPLPGNELRGPLAQEQRLQQLYSFEAGPGEGTVTLEVKTSGTGSQLEVSIIDQDSITLLRLLTTSNQGKRSEPIQLPARRRLTLKLSAPGSNHNGSYVLTLKGRAFENIGTPAVGEPPPPVRPIVSRDTTPPRIKIISPAVSRGQGQASKADKITVICEVTDDSGVNAVLIQGQPAQSMGNNQFSAGISLKPGENEIFVTDP